MKTDNTTKIEKSQRLADELKHLAFGKESSTDEISEFLREKERVDLLIERLMNRRRVEHMTNMIKQVEVANGRSRLIDDLEQRRTKKRVVKVVKLFSGIAAVIFSVSILLWYVSDREQLHLVVDHKAQLESIIVPTLLTHNQRLNLSEKEGQLLEDSIHHVKLDKDGYLVYSDKITDHASGVVYDELVVPSNYISRVTLSDGSVVTMNACSKMKYPVAFAGDFREVELEGEAYFKVTKSEKPFIVKSGEMRIKVYGTEFNVKAYGDGVKETVLVSGKVGVTVADGGEIVMLPNQIALCGSDNIVTIESVDASEYLYWMNNQFKFKSAPLCEVLDELSRWYGVEFTNCSRYSTVRISIFSDRSNSLDELLSLIESVSDLKFAKEGGGVYSVNN